MEGAGMDWRCERCDRLLGKFAVEPEGSIKCERCGHLNALPSVQLTAKSVRADSVRRLASEGDIRVSERGDDR